MTYSKEPSKAHSNANPCLADVVLRKAATAANLLRAHPTPLLHSYANNAGTDPPPPATPAV